MKPRMRYWNGFWWCRRMGVTGQGVTMEEAYFDMWNLYREFVRESYTRSQKAQRNPPRAG